MELGVQRTGLGVLVILSFILAIGVGIQDFRFDSTLAREHAAGMAREREIGSIETALSNFRAAEVGYLAPGQGPDFWIRRASEFSDQIDTTIARLSASSASTAARAKYEAAAAALADLIGIDKRARNDIQNDQRFLASDLVFVDGLDASQRLATELAAARGAETTAGAARTTMISSLRLGMNGAALGLLLATIVWTAQQPKQAAPSAAASMAQMLRDLPPPVKATPVAPAVPAPAQKPAPAALSISLIDTAELCADLARVMDDRDVPALLERTAKVLDAKGVIVWVADKAGLVLRPAIAHGYPDKVLSRVGTLDVGADNVTSLAFRSLRPQTMNGTSAGSPAAIAIPLMTVGGCAGVMAAEVRESRPPADMIAVAKIISAQFATLIAPAEAEVATAAPEPSHAIG